jgi:ribosome biogenesis GTPase
MANFSDISLEDLGWNEGFAAAFAPYLEKGWRPARLIRDNKISYGALMEGCEEVEVLMSGRVYHEAETDAELPAVGDWVALELGGENEDSMIRARLPRQSCFSRKVPGDSTEEQVIAANVSLVAVVTEPGPDFSLRRMERYFTLISRSGARAVVLINKVDLYEEEDNEAAAEAIQKLNPEAEVHLISVKRRKGLKAVREYLKPGVSIAFVGSSGVGKSALVNRLLGDVWQDTGEVNEVTGKGRHTTTARELLVLEKGGIIIDNPGIKEVQMWTDETTLRERFADIEALAAKCQFGDCKHGEDRGCAIRAAVEGGQLEAERYEGFLKLDEEIAKLKKRRKKRQMTTERRNKRDHKVKARNQVDRRELEAELKPRARDGAAQGGAFWERED